MARHVAACDRPVLPANVPGLIIGGCALLLAQRPRQQERPWLRHDQSRSGSALTASSNKVHSRAGFSEQEFTMNDDGAVGTDAAHVFLDLR